MSRYQSLRFEIYCSRCQKEIGTFTVSKKNPGSNDSEEKIKKLQELISKGIECIECRTVRKRLVSKRVFPL